MNATWNITDSLVADRRAARESAAERHRLVTAARKEHRFSLRRLTGRHLALVSTTKTPTTEPAQPAAA